MTLSMLEEYELMEHVYEDMRSASDYEADEWVESDYNILNHELFTFDQIREMMR